MERSEVQFELNSPGADPNRSPQVIYPEGGSSPSGPFPSMDLHTQHILQQQLSQPDGGGVAWITPDQIQPRRPSRSGRSGTDVLLNPPTYMNSPGGNTPFLRQFHALPPNVRNPEEKLPDQPHLKELEKLKDLHIHQGSVCQFPEKVKKTGERYTEGLHNSPQRIQQTSVCQFATKVLDPDFKYADQPHLQQVDELAKLHLHQGSVCQFPRNASYLDKYYQQQLHQTDNETHLKQGSVIQFPRKLHSTKFDYFHPPTSPMKESLPMAHVPHPDHCLPSQARKQQTYITHPSQGPSKLLVRGVSSSPPGSPSGMHRQPSPSQWPPTGGRETLPRRGFQPEGGPKSFQWPPPKPTFHRSFQELPPPGPNGQTANSWNPQESKAHAPNQGAFVAPQKRSYNWPPNRTATTKQITSFKENKSRSMLELDEVMVVSSPGTVASYRPPPWSQFYRTQYFPQVNGNIQQNMNQMMMMRDPEMMMREPEMMMGEPEMIMQN